MSSHDEQLLDDFLEHHAQDTIYSDMTVEEYFAHYGVKGMKWGVRKGSSSLLISKAEKASVYDRATKAIDKDVAKLNAEYKASGGGRRSRSEYNKSVNATISKHLVESLNHVVGERAVLPYTVRLTMNGKNHAAVTLVGKSTIVHDESVTQFDFELVRDELGLVTAVRPMFSALMHQSLDDLELTAETEEYFAHYGVKGMKWGIRREDRGHGLTSFMIKNGASKDDVGAVKRGFARSMGSARLGVAGVNHRYKNIDLTKNAKARKRYEGEIHGVMQRALKQGTRNYLAKIGLYAAVLVVPPVGAGVVALSVANMGYNINIVRQNVKEYGNTRSGPVLKHAEDDTLVIPIVLKRDAFGLVTDIRIEGMVEDSEDVEHGLEHSDFDLVGDVSTETFDFLAHYGILGMKWGRRKGDSGGGSDGGSSDKPHEDAINVAALRKKKISQLSNAEMKAVTERMNLEKKYREMNPSDHEILMRKLRKQADTAAKITKWMVGPEGGKLLKAMGLDEKSRRADEKKKEKTKLEEAMAKQRVKNEKKAKRKEEKAKKTWRGLDENGVPYTVKKVIVVEKR